MATRTVETYPARVALEIVRADLAVLIGLAAVAGLAMRQGDVLGTVTASGQVRRRSRQLVTGSGFTTTSNSGTVADASVFRAGDVLKDVTGTTVGTVLTVSPTLNIVTLTANAATAVQAGAEVLASDGSQRAAAVSDDNSDGAGVTSVSAFIGGYLKKSAIRGLDASAEIELGGASVAGGVFKF